jgi:ATP-dependent helicase HrpA
MRNLPSIDSMCLIYSTLGKCEVLKQGLLGLILSRSFFSEHQESSVRTEHQFLDCLKRGRPLMPEAKAVCKIVADILTAYQAVTQQLKAHGDIFPDASRQDVLAQMDGLVSGNFLQTIPFGWLQHVPRYLQAMHLRLEKLSSAPASDAGKLSQIRPLVDAYHQLTDQSNATSVLSEITKLKWMIEEFRVSLFAQTLKTSIPISAKRIEKQIALCR